MLTLRTYPVLCSTFPVLCNRSSAPSSSPPSYWIRRISARICKPCVIFLHNITQKTFLSFLNCLKRLFESDADLSPPNFRWFHWLHFSVYCITNCSMRRRCCWGMFGRLARIHLRYVISAADIAQGISKGREFTVHEDVEEEVELESVSTVSSVEEELLSGKLINQSFIFTASW